MSRTSRLAALLLVVIAAGACESGATPSATRLPLPPPLPAPSRVASSPSAATAAPSASAVAAFDITAAGIRSRLEALLAVSTTPGFRSVGSSGYDAAADLVATEMRASGWQVTEDAFTTPAFADPGGSSVTIEQGTFGQGDVAPLIYAPAGDVTGPIVAIDWDGSKPPGTACTAAGFGHLPPEAIVLARPGGCYRRQQVLAAQEAGAAGFLAGYPDAEPGHTLRPTLIDPGGLTIPAAGVTGVVGDALAAAAAAKRSIRLATTGTTTQSDTRSIIAELPGTEPGQVVMLGAHLDSVLDGPGINDDGSGVAALLEIGRALAGSRPKATIRLAFWSGEELGLLGSTHYVQNLTDEERKSIVVYLNADMVASPNGFAGVYDDKDPASSAPVRDLLTAALRRAGGTPITVDIGGGSDHFVFGQAGIPFGGVFSGAGEAVSVDEAAVSGATAGKPADPCYHQACDDVANVDDELAGVLATALADVALQLATDPALVSP